MIKSRLITQIAKKQTILPEKDIATCTNLLIDLMMETLANGGRIEIRGFGSFNLHYRPPRNAHNPKTGERVLTGAKYRPHFKPGKDLRERVNGSRHLDIQAAAVQDEPKQEAPVETQESTDTSEE